MPNYKKYPVFSSKEGLKLACKLLEPNFRCPSAPLYNGWIMFSYDPAPFWYNQKSLA